MKLNLLKAQRVKFGLNQKDMAKYLSIDVTTYSRKENGSIQFKVNEINIIKKLFELNEKELCEIFFDD